MTTISDVLIVLIKNGFGRTETELAQAIFGTNGFRIGSIATATCSSTENWLNVEEKEVHPMPYRYIPVEHRNLRQFGPSTEAEPKPVFTNVLILGETDKAAYERMSEEMVKSG